MSYLKGRIIRYFRSIRHILQSTRNVMFNFLSTRQPIECSFMRIPRISAVIAGFWPQKHQSLFTVLRFLINSFAVAVGALGELSYGIVYLSNLVAALEAFCPGSTKLICVLKMWTFFVYNKDWYLIISQLREMVMQDAACPAKRRIIERLAATSGILSFILLASGSVTNAFFNLRPIIMMALRKWQGQEVGHDLPFNVVTTDALVNYPFYPLTYCILTLSGAMTVFTFSAVDGLFVCICFYTCGLFRMLQHDIRQVFAELELSDTKPTDEQNLKFRHSLAHIVERHNTIIDLCTKFTAKFSFIILWHFLSAAFVLCLSLLDLLLNYASIAVLIYIFYSIAASTQLFLYCIGGNYVSESSVEIADTLYDVPWYKCDVETRRMILMILRRSQKAQRIAVPFFTPSLPAFSSIISTAGSYIALLKTFL